METNSNGYKTVSPKEFSEVIKNPDVYLLDVRHADEYSAGHISGAHNIDVMAPDFMNLAKKELPKDMTIAVYCGSGKRSGMASDLLSKEGYKIVNLDGGMAAWNAAGF